MRPQPEAAYQDAQRQWEALIARYRQLLQQAAR